MVQSMTGFASTTLTLTTPTGTVPANLTIKTLNNRFLDISCKLPYQLAHLEPEVIKRAKKTLHRGSVFCSLYISNAQALKTDVFPSLALAEGYIKALGVLQNKLNLPGTVTISDFMTLPNLFETVEETDLQANSNVVLDAVDSLLHTIIAARELEGQALQKDLENRIEIINNNLALIEPRAQIVSEERRQHLLQEISSAFEKLPAEHRERELHMLCNGIEKIDVNEEIVRFKNHVVTFLKTLHDSNEQKGKKLDFILQEMFREINTLNAKLPDIVSSQPLISIKVELEKAREQVQNIV